MRLQVRLWRPDVEPVAGKRDPVHGALLGEPREHLALDRHRAALGHEVEHLGLEHVQPRVDEVGVDVLGPRLLEEALDAAVVDNADEAVAAGVGHGREQDRRLRAGRAVERDELGKVGLAQRVAVQREERARRAPSREPDRASGAERLRLDRVLERKPAVARSEGRADLVREVAAGDDRPLDAVPREVLERVREQRPVDEREHVLPRPVGQRPQPRPLPADEDDRRKASRHVWLGRPMPSYAKPCCAEALGVEHVAAVDEEPVPHPRPRLGPVELGELRPLGDEHGRVGPL